jgi:hypothetical protein
LDDRFAVSLKTYASWPAKAFRRRRLRFTRRHGLWNDPAQIGRANAFQRDYRSLVYLSSAKEKSKEFLNPYFFEKQRN